MRAWKRQSGAAMLTLVCVLTAHVAIARGATLPTQTRFPALDGGGPVLAHILVTALTPARDGTIYVGGIDTTPNNAPYANRPLTLLGSVWAVSHDHGRTWTQRVSTTDPHAFPKSGTAPWRDHTTLPIDFTPASITIDPRNPRIIYVAGCTDSAGRCAYPYDGPLVVRSLDGGQTWQTSLSRATIANTSALRAAYRYDGAIPTQGYAVVVDPRNSQRLYAAVSGLGVVSSTNGGRVWTYVTQPQSNFTTRPCELLLDPRNPNTLYELNRGGALYRTTDGGAHWIVRSPMNSAVGSTSSSLTFVGRTLYVTAINGLYASTDGGVHWHLAYKLPSPGGFYQSVRGAGGWVSVFGPQKPGPVAGLYELRDGQSWQPVADADKRGHGGALDFATMDAQLVTRMWEDHASRIVFTAGPLGGLYRWQSNL
jgi:hypothetical protein